MSDLETQVQQLAKDIAAALLAGERLPTMPPGISLEEAYEIQKAVVAIRSNGPLAGLKAGMTAPAMQAQFGLSSPIIGCLYAAGRLDPGVTIKSAPGVMIECELGLVVDAEGNAKTCGPVIEVPQLNLPVGDELPGVCLIASSIASDRFIAGSQLPILDSYDHIEVRLERNGKLLSSAPATDALGGPQPALSWMLEEARKWGLPMTEGMLCITGACGAAHPATPGQYLVDYGELGRIEFTVT